MNALVQVKLVTNGNLDSCECERGVTTEKLFDKMVIISVFVVLCFFLKYR